MLLNARKTLFGYLTVAKSRFLYYHQNYIPDENLVQVAPIHFFPFPIPLEMYILEHKYIDVQLGE